MTRSEILLRKRVCPPLNRSFFKPHFYFFLTSFLSLSNPFFIFSSPLLYSFSSHLHLFFTFSSILPHSSSPLFLPSKTTFSFSPHPTLTASHLVSPPFFPLIPFLPPPQAFRHPYLTLPLSFPFSNFLRFLFPIISPLPPLPLFQTY